MLIKAKTKGKSIGRRSRKPNYELLKSMLEFYNSAELGEMLGVSDATVRSWVHRNRQKGCDDNE